MEDIEDADDIASLLVMWDTLRAVSLLLCAVAVRDRFGAGWGTAVPRRLSFPALGISARRALLVVPVLEASARVRGDPARAGRGGPGDGWVSRPAGR